MIKILIPIVLAMGTILWVELVRDCYHTLAHYWKPLTKLHYWHHRVFRPDYTPVNDQIYRQAHWYNDVPEALCMLAFSFIPWAFLFLYHFPLHYVALTGSVYTLFFLISAIARGMGIPYAEELTDLTHRQGNFTEIPSHWLVNRSYHWRHHFDDQNAYYCGTFTILDQIMGTALSLKGKKIAVTGAGGSLGKSLLKHLYLNGAKVVALTSSDGEISLKIKEETR
jgi:monoglucosyldiacylglycerol epimerase